MARAVRKLVLAVVAVCGALLITWTSAAAQPPATTTTSAPSAPSTGPPIQIILPPTPAPSSSLGFKDFLVPLGTLLGAALGFAGAITGARLSADAQDRRARHDAEVKRHDEARAQSVKRLESFADSAKSLIAEAASIAGAKPEEWDSSAAPRRDALRLSAAQMLGASRLLDPALAPHVTAFIGSVLKVCEAGTLTQARQSARHCGAPFESLMSAIGEDLRTTRALAAHSSTTLT